MTVVLAVLERLQKEGELAGRQRLRNITRYLTILLSIVQSLSMRGDLQHTAARQSAAGLTKPRPLVIPG